MNLILATLTCLVAASAAGSLTHYTAPNGYQYNVPATGLPNGGHTHTHTGTGTTGNNGQADVSGTTGTGTSTGTNGYNYPDPGTGLPDSTTGGEGEGTSGSEGGDDGDFSIDFGDDCPSGQVLDAQGNCATPDVSRNIYMYAAPKVEAVETIDPILPKPKVHLNFVFIRTESGALLQSVKPVVVPPPKQKTLVYVLNKKPEAIETPVIEVPSSGPTEPELFFINYDGDSENVQLPGGISLQEALAQSLTAGHTIDSEDAPVVDAVADGAEGGDGSAAGGDDAAVAPGVLYGVPANTGAAGTIINGGGSLINTFGPSIASTGGSNGLTFGNGGVSVSTGGSNGVNFGLALDPLPLNGQDILTATNNFGGTVSTAAAPAPAPAPSPAPTSTYNLPALERQIRARLSRQVLRQQKN